MRGLRGADGILSKEERACHLGWTGRGKRGAEGTEGEPSGAHAQGLSPSETRECTAVS